MRQLKTSCTTNTSLQRVMQWIRLWSVERAASTALSSWPWNWIHLLCEGSTSPQWSGRRCRGATQLKATFPKHAQTAPADTARGRQPSFNLSLHGTMARQVCCVLRTKKSLPHIQTKHELRARKHISTCKCQPASDCLELRNVACPGYCWEHHQVCNTSIRSISLCSGFRLMLIS